MTKDGQTELSHNLNFFQRLDQKACAKPITVNRIFLFSFAFGVYFIEINMKTPLCNGNSPITNPITKIGVAHAFEQTLHSDAFCLFLVHWGLDKPLLKIQGGHII